jgi:hypothetical protein
VFDRGQGVEIFKQATDHAKIPGKFKLWCLQFELYPRLLWSLMIYKVAESRVEMIEKKCRAYTRKWLGLPKCLNNSALYGKGIPLELPITSIVEEYKAGKVRTVKMLRYSRDQTIRDDPPEVRTGKRWQAEVEVDRTEEVLRHRDIVGAVQTGRKGFGLLEFKPFSMSSDKENGLSSSSPNPFLPVCTAPTISLCLSTSSVLSTSTSACHLFPVRTSGGSSLIV